MKSIKNYRKSFKIDPVKASGSAERVGRGRDWGGLTVVSHLEIKSSSLVYNYVEEPLGNPSCKFTAPEKQTRRGRAGPT